ncbi:hypothetical protein JXM67_10320 [candidate division WOR-3 bacterium]|nr:hypothetical protein [candidate division WOR-3 bacterium]
MFFILLGVLAAYAQPEDSVTYHGTDELWWDFSRYWDEQYETSLSAFRTSQGSYDMFYWYQLYDGKVELPCFSFFNLRYTYHGRYNFEEQVVQHRVEPIFRLYKDFYAHAIIAPFYEKRYDEIGAGLSYRPSTHNWLYVYGIMSGFDHNNSMRHVSPGPARDPYEVLPYRLEIEGRGELPWMKTRLHAELGTHSKQYLDWPDSSWEVWKRDHDRSEVWGRLEFQPIQNLWVGSLAYWKREREQTLWAAKDSVIADTLHHRWIEPYVVWSPTERLELIAQHRIWRYDRGFDSLHYRRDFNILSVKAIWNPVDFLFLHAGYQRQWRYRYVDEEPEDEVWDIPHQISRLVFNGEFRFKSGVMFIVKEGIKANEFAKTFRRFHAHTSVHVYIPLGFLNELGEKKGEDKHGA